MRRGDVARGDLGGIPRIRCDDKRRAASSPPVPSPSRRRRRRAGLGVNGRPWARVLASLPWRRRRQERGGSGGPCESLNSKQAASISTASRFPCLQHASGAATSRDAARLPAGGGRCEHEQVSGPKNRLRAVRAFGRSSRASAGRQAENGRENWAPICDHAAPSVETGRHCTDSGQPFGGPARDSATPALTGSDSTHGRVTSCRGYYERSISILIGSTPTRSRPRLP